MTICDTCKYYKEEWDSNHCDGYGGHIEFEPQEDKKMNFKRHIVVLKV